MLEKIFRLKENNSTVRAEMIGGVITFMTMAYIIFVNPAILGGYACGMNREGVMLATCVASALITLLMGVVANYPIAVAPGMGMNAIFAVMLCTVMKIPWQIALGLVFLSGIPFLLITFFKVRETIIDAIPECLKLSAAVGIGVFIAFVGLQEAGLVKSLDATLVTLGDVCRRPQLIALAGLGVTIALMAMRVPGAILLGLFATAAMGLAGGVIKFPDRVFSVPSARLPGLDINIKDAFLGLFKYRDYFFAFLALLFFDVFDTMGTLIGVGEQAGFMKNGKLPRISRALFCDSIGTPVGAVLGTSTMTSYIESSAGVAAGARTGLANVFTALLFAAAIFFIPLAGVIGGAVVTTETVVFNNQSVDITRLLHPITAPALIIVGSLMVKSIAKIKWDDITEAVPAFLTIVVMPFTFNISHGLAAGFIAYPVMKVLAGRAREVHWLMYVLAALFVLRYACLPY